MPLFWLIVTPIAIVVAAITLVDLFRRHRGGWSTAGWAAAVLVLPIVGSLIYWATRRDSPAEAEEAYLAENDLRHGSANRFYDA